MGTFRTMEAPLGGDTPSTVELSAEARAAFGKGPVLGRHCLNEHPLFSDDALIDLLDRHPRELVYAITMGHDPAREENRLAAHDGVPGRDLLEAVKRGRLWLNVTRVNRSGYGELIEGLYAQLATQVPGFRPRKTQGTVIVSSPQALVYLHADGPSNVLWQVRGRKKLWVYPALDERFLPRNDLEDILAGARHEYLAWRPEFDRHATCHELGPGDLASWPQNAPHRVTNLDCVNVALSTEHFTAQSVARARVYSANRFFRNRFGLVLSTRESGLAALAKIAVHRAARAAGLEPEPGRTKRWAPTLRVSSAGLVELS